MYEDSKDNLWAGVQNGLWRWKPGPPKFYPLPGEPNGIQALGEDEDGTLLVGWQRRNPDDSLTEKPKRTHCQALSDSSEPKGCSAIAMAVCGSELGPGLVHVHQGRTDVFAPSDGLSGENVHSFFEDREGNIWVATLNGLDRFRDFAVATLSVNQGLSNALVGSVLAARDGSVWIGTFDGLNRWNNGQITVYRERTAQNRSPGVREIDGGGLPDNGLHLFSG